MAAIFRVIVYGNTLNSVVQLDPRFDMCFKRRQGMLASFAERKSQLSTKLPSVDAVKHRSLSLLL